jgi:NADH-ubiquinone oxidoreductase chain 4L
MVLGVYIIFMLSLGLAFYFYSLVYLIFTACEGALGLSILVVMGRTHGRDYFVSFRSLMD